MGGVNGTGVAIAGGATNNLLNRGLLSTMSGVDGLAIGGTFGNDKVDNFGAIIGSVDLGIGMNELFNRPDAWLTSGPTINVGSGTFMNAGTFDPGGRRLLRTTLTGNFAQQGTPTWLLDIGEVGHSDGLFASGRADFGNSLTTLNLFGSRTAPTGSGIYTLFTTASGLSGAQFKLGSLFGAMPIGQTFTLGISDTALTLSLQPSSGVFYWNGAVSNTWSDPFLNGVSNWTRQPGKDHIFGTPGAASDVIFEGNAVTLLGANFSIGSLSGTGIISLADKILTTGASGLSTTWAGSLVGNGSMVKTGSGAFTLSGVNVYTGSTTVAGGQLFVDGWLGGHSIRVLDGALLGGNGVVPTATIERGGVLAPGSSIGTLSVNGDLTFDAGSTYRVETTSNSSDFVWVEGSLLGSGATVHVQPGGSQRYHPITFYGIMRAPGARAGIFTNVFTDAVYLDPSLQYGSQGVQLTLRRNDVDFRSAGTRGNQSAVAMSLNALVRTAVGEMAGVINNVYDLSNGDAVRAMGSMTGVLHQHVALGSFLGTQTFMDVNMARLGHVTNRAGASSVNPALATMVVAASPDDDRQGAWFSGVGGMTSVSGSDGDASARVSDRGFAVGYDAAIGNHLILGGSAGIHRRTWNSRVSPIGHRPRCGTSGPTGATRAADPGSRSSAAAAG